jgi:hypothetical protein
MGRAVHFLRETTPSTEVSHGGELQIATFVQLEFCTRNETLRDLKNETWNYLTCDISLQCSALRMES